MRLKNLEIGYTLPKRISQKMAMQNMRVYLSGVNLFTFSPFKLWDPDLQTGATNYPNNRIINIGLRSASQTNDNDYENILKTFGLLLLSGTAFVACDDYLDRQPDEQLTPDQIFLKASTTEQYLTNVCAYQRNYSDPSGQTLPWAPCADESSIAYTGRSYTQINYDTWDPSINLQRSYTYNNIYKGIREASYFIQYVYECPK